MFDELKTHLRANSTVLRSKTPELVLQELWGLLLAHFAIRQLMARAAWPRRLDPDRLSFTHAVRVIKRKLPQAAAIPPRSVCQNGAMQCSRPSHRTAVSVAVITSTRVVSSAR